ncbi:MAG: HTTM domain-containing protein [Cyclobacteriaceae bacterium]
MPLKERLFRPVDNSPLVFFRIAFGFLLVAEAWGAIAVGWVKEVFIDPQYFFTFIGFSWLETLAGNTMYFYFFAMGAAGVMVMLGLYYRLSMAMYAILWAGSYFFHKEAYNNHHYLMVILTALMVFVPANQYASLDVKRNPKIKSLTCPQWCIWIFASLMAVVYFYASVAKLYPDWLNAEPISIWFEAKKNYWLIGPLLTKSWFHYFISWGGILFDFFIVPALIWKKTRKYAFMVSLFFHLFNSAIFQIGVFPYLAIAIEVFFIEPDLIRRLFFKNKPPISKEHLKRDTYKVNNAVLVVLGLFLTIQVLLPLRHWLYQGNVHWTEEGHRLSWHMMLRSKNGYVSMKVVDNDSGQSWFIKSSDYLTSKQSRAIAVHPDMLWQFVQILKNDFRSQGHDNVSIFAIGKARLNKSDYQELYDPSYDLASVEWQPFEHSEWLLPLAERE